MVWDPEPHCGLSIQDDNKNNNSRMCTQRVFIKNPQFAGKFGNMAQLGGDFILGPGALRAEYCFSHLGLTDLLGPICTFASRMQHAEDREYLGNDGRKISLTTLCPDVEVSELAHHLGITARPPSPSSLPKSLPVGGRSQRDCSDLLPDELVVVPSQLEHYRSSPTR